MPALTGQTVTVLGGGIGGLTTALAFAKAGASVCVYERAGAIREVGAGIQITPNAGRALRALGVWEALVDNAVISRAVVPTDAMTGRPIARFDLTGKSPPYIFIHRARLIDVLAKACEGQGVTLSLGMTALEAQPDGSAAFADAHGKQTRSAPADLLVCADGIRSIGRPLLNGPAAPLFTGQVAWRALVQADHPPEARIHMAPGRHVVTYPLGEGVTNIVAVQERSDWAAEGWHHADDPANVRAAFSDCGKGLRALLEAVEQVNLWGLFRHPVAETWTGPSLALVGDAAHPTLPFLAQGANLAIEDAYCLARICEGQGKVAGHPQYQETRRPRALRAIAAANANARNYHLKGVPRVIAHLGLRALGQVAPDAFLRRMDWLYEYDVTQAQHAGPDVAAE